MKKFFGEFKKFITRGNVLDLAVGVIIGSAFTGIVNGLSNNVLKPIINWLLSLVLGQKGLTGAVTMLSPAYTAEGTVDLTKSIYIDWGAFISAIINFFLIAMVLFIIVRAFNKFREGNAEFTKSLKKFKLSKQDKKELKARGIKRSNLKAVKEYIDEKEKIAEEKKQAELALEEAKKAEEANKPTVESLLADIKELLASKK